MLVLSVNETVSSAGVNVSRWALSNASGEALLSVGLAGALVQASGVPGALAVTVTLTEAQRAAAVLLLCGTPGGDGGAVVLDLPPGAVLDLAGNALAASPSVPVIEAATVKLFVHGVPGISIGSVKAQKTDSIEVLCLQMSTLWKISVDGFYLTFHGKPLHNFQSIGDSGLYTNCTISMCCRGTGGGNTMGLVSRLGSASEGVPASIPQRLGGAHVVGLKNHSNNCFINAGLMTVFCLVQHYPVIMSRTTEWERSSVKMSAVREMLVALQRCSAGEMSISELNALNQSLRVNLASGQVTLNALFDKHYVLSCLHTVMGTCISLPYFSLPSFPSPPPPPGRSPLEQRATDSDR